jgi:hypothetical protein
VHNAPPNLKIIGVRTFLTSICYYEDMCKKHLIVLFHILIILLAYSSPIWLDWRFVLVGVILNFIQILILGGCVLSHAQFEDKKLTFHEWYLHKLGLKPNRTILNFVLRYIIPFILLVLALVFQVVFNNRALIQF